MGRFPAWAGLLLLGLGFCAPALFADVPPYSPSLGSTAPAVVLTPAEREWLSAHDGKIRLGIAPTPPHVMFENGQCQGIMIDHLRLVERKLGCHFEQVRFNTWGEALRAARDREVDVLPGIQKTAERLQYLQFTAAYDQYPNVIVVRNDRKLEEDVTLAQMEQDGWVVAVNGGSAVQEYLRQHHPSLRLSVVSDAPTALIQVSQGEADAAVNELWRNWYYIERLKLGNLRLAGNIPLMYQLHFAVRKDWPVLTGILDKGVASVTNEENKAIEGQWISVGRPPFYGTAVFWLVAGGVLLAVLLALALVVFWNRSLRRLVADRTAQLQAELQARQAAESTLHGIFLAAPLGISIQKNRVTQSANPAWCEIVGLPEEQLVGQNSRILYESDAEWERVGQEVAKGVEATGLASVETRFRCGGKLHDVLLRVAPLRRGDPAAGLVGVVQEITERKASERKLELYRQHLEALVQERTAELAEARDQSEAANRAKSAFLSNMSHELRTPLTSVLGFAEILARDPAIPGRARDSISVIIRSGEHLLSLVNNILDLSKIEAGRMAVERRDVSLYQLVNDVASMMEVRAAAKGLRLLQERSPVCPEFVNTDPGKLRQILVNLIGNAIKFTPAGQVVLRLHAEPAPDGYTLTFEVRDTGIGISPQDLKRIFLPFEQIMTMPGQGGTGLGLTITLQYVQMLGGKITVDSQLGVGSSFRLQLPVNRSRKEGGQAAEVPAATAANPAADIRILVVEDQPDNRVMFQCMLAPLQFQLREALNGEEAIALFEQWRPHLIFMDRRMPLLDGLEATRQIRARPGGEAPIIVAVSAHSFKEEQQEMLAAGCTDFLCKPFSLDELLAVLKKHLHLDLIFVSPPEGTFYRPLSAEDLRGLPAVDLAALYHLVVEGSHAEIVEWMAAQKGLSPVVSEGLSALLKEYRYDVLQEMLEQVLPPGMCH